jgi:hypothetical protein
MARKVRNLNGTSDNSCRCGSWLKHWETYGGGKGGFCAEKTCTKSADVGAHVQKADSTDKNWYIIPLCIGHNSSTGGELEIMDSTVLVSANTSETCAKR